MLRILKLKAILAFVAVASLPDYAMACWWRGSYVCMPIACCEPLSCDLISSSAIIVVQVPTEARIYIDDVPTVSTGPVRVFTTPQLEIGKQYSYRIKAEEQRNGTTVSTTKEVGIVPGETIIVDFGAISDEPRLSLPQISDVPPETPKLVLPKGFKEDR